MRIILEPADATALVVRVVNQNIVREGYRVNTAWFQSDGTIVLTFVPENEPEVATRWWHRFVPSAWRPS